MVAPAQVRIGRLNCLCSVEISNCPPQVKDIIKVYKMGNVYLEKNLHEKTNNFNNANIHHFNPGK